MKVDLLKMELFHSEVRRKSSDLCRGKAGVEASQCKKVMAAKFQECKGKQDDEAAQCVKDVASKFEVSRKIQETCNSEVVAERTKCINDVTFQFEVGEKRSAECSGKEGAEETKCLHNVVFQSLVGRKSRELSWLFIRAWGVEGSPRHTGRPNFGMLLFGCIDADSKLSLESF